MKFTSLLFVILVIMAVAVQAPEETVEYLEGVDFTSNSDVDLAESFFSENVDNVNQNSVLFTRYLQSQGFPFDGMVGEIQSYHDGILAGNNQNVDLVSFAKSELAEDYSIFVDRGGDVVLSLKKKSGETRQIDVKGDIGADADGLMLSSGELDGVSIIGGTSIRIDSETGVVTGIASSIEGLEFYSPSSFSFMTGVGYDEITFDGARIVSYDSTSPLYLQGKASIENYDALRDSLFVRSDSEFTLNGYTVEPGSDVVELYFGSERGFVDRFERGLDVVHFSDVVRVGGADFDVRFLPSSVSTGDFFSFSKKGFYGNGDIKLSDQDAQNVQFIQRIVGATPDGKYGLGTEKAVRVWQKANGLPATGRFGGDSLERFLSQSGGVTVSPKGGSVEMGIEPNRFRFHATGNSDLHIGEQLYQVKDDDIIRNLRRSGKQFMSPYLIESELSDGSINQFEKNPFTASSRDVTVQMGGKEYSLQEGKAYVVSAKQSAFTKAVAPSSESLKGIPEELKSRIEKAGHVAIVYVQDGRVRVSESIWKGVQDGSFESSYLGGIEDSINGVYGFVNADNSKIIAGVREDGQQNIGWFFTDVDSTLGTTALNEGLGKKYSSYRSCVGQVCAAASYGRVDLREHAKYVPLQNADHEALKGYVEGFGIRGTFRDISKSSVFAGVLRSGISALDSIGQFQDWFGYAPTSFTTPAQLIYGNLENRIIEIVEPITTDTSQNVNQANEQLLLY